MAGVEVEKIVPNTEEKNATKESKETVETDDSATAVEVEIKEDGEVPKVEKEIIEETETAPVEIPEAVEDKDVKPAAEEEKAVEVKTV